jgi:GT2 family glycosyltransferase
MKLSVVVANHNACALLKQALNSFATACKAIDYEIIIADNASTDKSLEMVATDFPDAKFVTNEIYTSVAKANNKALQLCTGEYILLVNADTISGKDSVEKMIAFMDDHKDAGGLSVRMLNPQGRFLPESIHGLNNTWGAFLKFIGFAKFLSKTRLYDRNRKDWVEEFQISEIDILSSDCMFMRSSVLNEIGLFDERFFMYGHNIDLSYRMRIAGFKNYYFPKTYFINLESKELEKLSWSYIKYFYGAMVIFAIKYLIRMPEIKVQGIPQLFHSTYEVK